MVKKGTTKKKKRIIKEPLNKKIEKTTKLLIYSAITFILSLIIFFATNDETIQAIFGLIMVLAGAITILFLITEIILYFSKRK